MAKLNAILMQVLQLSIQHGPEDPHETLDFIIRPFPVLRGEGVNSEVFYAEFSASLNDLPQVFGPGSMTSKTGKTSF
jgi:hypothetical protein